MLFSHKTKIQSPRHLCQRINIHSQIPHRNTQNPFFHYLYFIFSFYSHTKLKYSLLGISTNGSTFTVKSPTEILKIHINLYFIYFISSHKTKIQSPKASPPTDQHSQSNPPQKYSESIFSLFIFYLFSHTKLKYNLLGISANGSTFTVKSPTEILGIHFFIIYIHYLLFYSHTKLKYNLLGISANGSTFTVKSPTEILGIPVLETFQSPGIKGESVLVFPLTFVFPSNCPITHFPSIFVPLLVRAPVPWY